MSDARERMLGAIRSGLRGTSVPVSYRVRSLMARLLRVRGLRSGTAAPKTRAAR